MKKKLILPLSFGFTLIELLVVIGILTTLLSIVLIAINPARQFKQANDTKRRSDVTAILNAIHQYAADNRGTLPSAITTSVQNIAKTGADICDDLVDTYIAALPVDPKTGSDAIDKSGCASSYDTGYTVVKSSTNNRVTISAPNTEIGPTITITR